jgi:spoIIIJ-associated protein
MDQPRGAFTAEQIDDALDVLADFMEQTLVALDVGEDLEVDLSFVEGEGFIQAELDGDRDDIALIIGKRGQTLDAVQYVANAIVITQCDAPIPVRLDAQGYRDRRAGQLEKIADRAVATALKRGREVELEPMTSSERKVIHLYLKDHPRVSTASTGKDPSRRLVIEPHR